MITVGIPTLNGPGRLQRVLESIIECTHLDGVRVLVCDDGSMPEHLHTNGRVIEHCAKRLPGLEFFTNDARRGIACSWNRLTRKYSDADVVVLLNDDVEVVKDWLDVLAFSLRANECTGMVGLNSFMHLTKEQHAKLHPNAQPHERVPLVDYRQASLLDGGGSMLSAQGPIFGFRREVYDLVGGFDEMYFCFYEELDFAVRLRHQGFFSFMASHPMCYHMGGATNSDPQNLDANSQLAKSRSLFIEKWGKTPSQLRDEFLPTYKRPPLREWNSQLANWK